MRKSKNTTGAKTQRRARADKKVHECTAPDWTAGISVSASAGEWTDALKIRRYDYAQNHGRNEPLFYLSADAVFVADHLLAQGEKAVLDGLMAEALRIWCWHDQTGKPLGRVPTGFECEMMERPRCSVVSTLANRKKSLSRD